MFWIKDFVRKYPQAIVKGPVPVAQIIEKIKREYGAEELSVNHIPNGDMYAENAYFYGCDEQIDIAREDICIKAIRIPVTEQTRHYTQKDFVPWDQDDHGTQDIYVVYEEHVGYAQSNSGKLFLEIAIAKGVSQGDIDCKSENYDLYLWRMQIYLDEYAEFGNSSVDELIWSQEMKME